jgi:hypothetical protein
MKKIYLVGYDNGVLYGDYEKFIFKYCYTTKGQANQAIEELKQDKDFLESINYYFPERINFWIEEIELVEEK